MLFLVGLASGSSSLPLAFLFFRRLNTTTEGKKDQCLSLPQLNDQLMYFWQYLCPYRIVLGDHTSSLTYWRSLLLGWYFIHSDVIIYPYEHSSFSPKWFRISLHQVVAFVTGTVGDKKQKVFVPLGHLESMKIVNWEPQRYPENIFSTSWVFLLYHCVARAKLSFYHQLKSTRY